MSAISGRLLRIACSGMGPEEQRSPLGFTRSGRPVWPIIGAEPDDDDDDDVDDDDDDADDTDSGGAGEKGEKDSGADESDDDLSAAQALAERYKKRMKAADKRATEAEARIRELEKSGQPADEQVKADLEESRKQIESLTTANQTLRLENSFLLHNKFQWHDPKDVLALVLKDEDLEVDEDGEVQGMDAALKRLAKKKPWLVKQADSRQKGSDDEDEDEEEEEDERETRKPAAASRSGAPQNRRRRRDDGLDRQKILQTYPALNRR